MPSAQKTQGVVVVSGEWVVGSGLGPFIAKRLVQEEGLSQTRKLDVKKQ